MHANGDIERGCPLRILRMSVVVSVVSVVSVSGECQWFHFQYTR
jgi:hypothetical protein